MDHDQFKAKKQWAGESKPSMKRRRLGHDYRSRRIYMLTLTVEGRRQLLGHITGNGQSEPAEMHLSPLGQAVSDAVLGIPKYYPAIRIIVHQVMPDHLHVVLFVTERIPVHLGRVVNGFKTGCNKVYRDLMRQGLLDTNLPALWEEDYNDTILDRKEQFARMKNYVLDNPRRYAIKRANPDLFRVQRDVRVGDYTFAALGNIFLLDAAALLQVQCSRSLTEAQMIAVRDHFLRECENGAVLVSPSISPGEKMVMRAAFERGFPIVILQENGFAPLAKPGGARFDACADGRLLLLAPWPHHNRNINITRDKALTLNQMAWAICSQHA